ncbi:MAG TPA: hypothetical protein DHW82_06365 [Spirochaetia bacterium]|nr:MAG: hypothetical protein A2Y41_03365 [Spirochaetes bacterium GWB1_36_13]HCL56617.1 hypothetical protein [Spirochaetia bacterium]
MGLKRDLKLIDVFSIASGAMISSGLFILPGIAFVKAGPGMIISYFLAGILALTGALSQSELVSAMPKAGGEYFYTVRSMGPAIGTINGMISWFSITLKSSFSLIGMAAFVNILFHFNIEIIAVVLTILFLILNIIGVKEAGRFQVVLVIGLIGLLVFFVLNGINQVNADNLIPFAAKGWGAVFSTAGFVFVSYGGLLKIGSVAEETQNPGRNIPLGMFLALLVVGVLYTMVVFVTTGVLGVNLVPDGIPTLMPISDAAEVFLGKPGKIALSIAAVLAFVSTANAGIMAASRYPMALSRDNLLPLFFGKISKKFGTPFLSILLTGVIMALSFFLQLEFLVKAASTVILFNFILSCLSVMILRFSKIQNYRPSFKSPLFPWIQIVGIGGFVFLIIEMGKEALLMSLLMALAGLLVYLFYGRNRSKKEYALLHLIERITNKAFVSRKLETELKEIIRERDNIIQDRFDEIIENSLVLDIENPMTEEELFQFLAEKMSSRFHISPEEFYRLLIEREKQSSTALTPYLAIPHIVISGIKLFDIMMVRLKKGVGFSAECPDIRAVFVLAGSQDERNFHLRAISAIAQIVQNKEFEKRWEKAKNIEELRDIVLLGKRHRHSGLEK